MESTEEGATDNKQSLWVANVAVAIIGIVYGVYVTAVLIINELRRKKGLKNCANRNARERKIGGMARGLCIGGSFVLTIFSALKLSTSFVDGQSQQIIFVKFSYDCNALGKSREICLIICFFIIYFFLWTRQRIFYIHKALSHLNSRKLSTISYVILILWVTYAICASCCLMVIVHYEHKPGLGCVTASDTAKYLRAILISYVIVSTLMQVSLLYLFVYPIISRSALASNSSNDNRSRTRVMGRVKKAIILTLICIFTDIISLVISIVSFSKETNMFSSTYIINLIVNVMCIIFCFDNWNKMLIPCWKTTREERAKALGNMPSTSHASNRGTSITKSSLK
ncbi:uncharacterized protein LOC120345122 [Styela clava]